MLTGGACSLAVYDGLVPVRVPQDAGAQLGLAWLCGRVPMP